MIRMFARLAGFKRLLASRWFLSAFFAALVLGAYYWAYERGAAAERLQCQSEVSDARIHAYEQAQREAAEDRRRARETQEQIGDERSRTDEHLDAAGAAGDLADCSLDDYRLCLARAAARGESASACAGELDGAEP